MPSPGARAPAPLAVAAFVAVVFFAQAFGASLRHSLTWDEPSFISAGYAYLTRGDFRFNPSHPPFLQVMEAAPLLLMDLASRRSRGSSGSRRRATRSWALGTS